MTAFFSKRAIRKQLLIKLIQLQLLIKHQKVVKNELTRDSKLQVELTNTYFEKVIR